MSDIELKELIASLAIDRKEEVARGKRFDRQQQETSRQIKKMFEGIEEIKAAQKETGRQQQETDLQIKRAFEDTAELKAAQKETDLQIKRAFEDTAELKAAQKETDLQIKRTFEGIAEMRAAQKETDRHIQEAIRLSEENSRRQGATDHNNGDIAEELFYRAFDKTKRIGDIQFDYVHPNFSVPAGKRSALEIDIVLLGGSWCAVVEVKYKCHPNDVTRFCEKHDKILTILARHSFDPYYPQKYMFAMASNLFISDCEERAHKCGIALVRFDGQALAIDTSHFKYALKNTSCVFQRCALREMNSRKATKYMRL